MNALDTLAQTLRDLAATTPLMQARGVVTDVTPSSLRVAGLSAFLDLGDTVAYEVDGLEERAEVIRLDRGSAVIKPLGSRSGARLGLSVRKAGALSLTPCAAWKGRVVNALGVPVDGLGPLPAGPRGVPADGEPPPALSRGRVSRPLRTGVRVIDIFTPLCAGQRIGIFAGSGVGKSTMLGMLASCRGFDTVVVALVGERGREVREFIEDCLGENRARSIVVVATGDESPMMRRLAARSATAIAEVFRDAGETVLLIVDSVTRYAHAARDVALAAGEPAVARGYPPSVFSELPRLLERAGPGTEGTGGSITGLFSVLVDGDDHNDPVADTIRGTLDGHVVLDRKIAAQGRYPAVDLLASLSRLAQHAWTPEQRVLVGKLREMIARFEDSRDLRAMGAYQPGSDAELDQAIVLVPRIYEALAQSPATPLSADAFRDLSASLQKSK